VDLTTNGTTERKIALYTGGKAVTITGIRYEMQASQSWSGAVGDCIWKLERVQQGQTLNLLPGMPTNSYNLVFGDVLTCHAWRATGYNVFGQNYTTPERVWEGSIKTSRKFGKDDQLWLSVTTSDNNFNDIHLTGIIHFVIME